jgi:hypothetical protein
MSDKSRIARIWRGRVPAAKADEYARYNYEAGIKPLEETALGVQPLREDRGAESEFITISYTKQVKVEPTVSAADCGHLSFRYTRNGGRGSVSPPLGLRQPGNPCLPQSNLLATPSHQDNCGHFCEFRSYSSAVG